MRAALAKRLPDLVLPKAAWRKPWVIHCTAWGHGAEAVLRYLARYVFRVAITEGRIVGLDDDGVTIRHKHRASGRWHTTRLSGHEFMRRFLQHVLPKGLHKVRYSGLWHDLPSAPAAGRLYSPHQLRKRSGDLRLRLCGEVRPEARRRHRKLAGCAGGYRHWWRRNATRNGLSCHRASPPRRGEPNSRSNVAPMGLECGR